MKKIGLLLIISAFWLLSGNLFAQVLVCNSQTYFALDETCSHTIDPDEVLDGLAPDNCIVELDKVAPFGNGPWEPGVFVPADINKTYGVRVRHTPSGNSCTGTVKAEDKLPPTLGCNTLTTVDLGASTSATVNAGNLNIVATDGCSAVTLSPPSFNFDCSDMGITTVQLSASDASGNLATCSHNILVIGGDGCKPACVSECPASLTVSFEQGAFNLLPAYQAGNLAAFDVYGNALYDPGCVYLDSFFLMNYQAGSNGQNWFSRGWGWINDQAQLVSCQQYIVFPNTHTVTVSGVVFQDTDDDCNADAGESGASLFPLKLTYQPSGVVQFFNPESDGTYSFDVEFGMQDTSADMSLVLPPYVTPACPNALHIPNSSQNPSIIYNIGLQSDGDCPVMSVSLGTPLFRRCLDNYMEVNYCNNGLDTAYGAFVTVDLDELLSLQSASAPYTVSGPEQLYTFQVGDVPPLTCRTIGIIATVDCNAMIGQTLCSEAHVYPDVPCSGSWQGARIEASAQCAGDSVALTLKNTGLQDMGTALEYVVVEDFIMYKQNTFKLNVGQSTTIKTEANGSTWRIEAEQEPGLQANGPVVAAIEGCGGLNHTGVINALGAFSNSAAVDQHCAQVLGSYDPNDKSAVPTGVGADHIIRANQDLEYSIRFQNTGNDTAFNVIIVDTLSSLLDISSLRFGVSSHSCRVDVYPGNIVHFVFQPILLPDSLVNEPASHGYVSFQIRQQPDLPDGTRIENRAAIYFDNNEAVITNTTFHTIGHPVIDNPPLEVVSDQSAPSCHDAANGEIHITASGGVPPYHYEWSNPDLQGADLTGLAAGTYALTLTDSYRAEWFQTFTLTAPDPLDLSVNTTPAHGNQLSGTANAVTTGGVGPYEYAWSNGATDAGISNLAAGNYDLTVTDANGCTVSQSLQVGLEVDPIAYTVQSSQPKCHDSSDGVIEVSVSGGLEPYTYTWENPDLHGNMASGLPAGNYPLSMTDALGTQTVINVVLTAPDPLAISLLATPAHGNDPDGSVDAAITGGSAPYQYLWSDGSTAAKLSQVPAGLYSLTITDDKGCTAGKQVVVEQIAMLLASYTRVNPNCYNSADGSIEVTVAGGQEPYDFIWSDPNLTGNHVTGLASGVYGLTITDAAGSQLFLFVVLQAPAPINLLTSSTPDTGTPDNGTARVTVFGGAGGYQFHWSNGQTDAIIENLAAGEYTVTVTDQNGCSESESVVVEEILAANEPAEASQIRIFPNPAQDHLTVDMGKVADKLLRLDILTADGRVIERFEQATLAPEMHLNLEKTGVKGLIMLVFRDSRGAVWTRKVVVE